MERANLTSGFHSSSYSILYSYNVHIAVKQYSKQTILPHHIYMHAMMFTRLKPMECRETTLLYYMDMPFKSSGGRPII